MEKGPRGKQGLATEYHRVSSILPVDDTMVPGVADESKHTCKHTCSKNWTITKLLKQKRMGLYKTFFISNAKGLTAKLRARRLFVSLIVVGSSWSPTL